jgi:hypothetical protein
MHGVQRLVPAPLKLSGHQTIGGIDGIVLSTGTGGSYRACCSASSSCLCAADVSVA